jgi:hypothetical protein
MKLHEKLNKGWKKFLKEADAGWPRPNPEDPTKPHPLAGPTKAQRFQAPPDTDTPPADYGDESGAGETEELSLFDQGKEYFTKVYGKAKEDDSEAIEALEALAEWLEEETGGVITLSSLYD